MISSALFAELKKYKIEYKENFGLKGRTTFRIGGTCELALFPKNAEEIAICASVLDNAEKRFCVIGNASNTLFSDNELDLCVVFTTGAKNSQINGTKIIAEAGASLPLLSNASCDAGLTGLEFACGIPASVGGAVFMNAGAYGDSMENVVIKSRAYDRKSGSVKTIESHEFGYRESIYKNDRSLICLDAFMELKEGEREIIRAKMRELIENRKQKQPLQYPSAGSYFKRPEGDFAGRLIEICGLKGTRVGGAMVSEKHAGFIINADNATFQDVMRLEELVVETVMKHTGVELKREVEVIE